MIVEGSWLLGVGFALLAAVGFAAQFLCIRIGTQDGRVVDAVLVSLVCNVVIFAVLTAVFYRPPYGELFTPLSLVSFVFAGISGSLLARLFMFKSIETIGANLTSPIISSNVIFSTVFAVVLLGERLTPSHAGGILLIVAGLAIVSWETSSSDDGRSTQETRKLLALPLLAALCIGVEPIFISVGISEGTPVMAGLVVNATAATVGFAAYMVVNGSAWDISLPREVLRWYIGAGIATSVAFALYFSALEVAPIVLVMPLLQTTPLLVVILSLLFLPRWLETITWRVWSAAVIVVVGATLVSLSG